MLLRMAVIGASTIKGVVVKPASMENASVVEVRVRLINLSIVCSGYLW